MGSGKSTVGRLAARLLGWTFLDLDRVIARRAGRSVRAIFASRGESAFRRLESAALRDAARRSDRVIAAGGGVPTIARNLRWLRRAGVVVWLRVPAAVLARRLARSAGRPLLRAAAGRPASLRRLVASLLRKRAAAYRRAADAIVRGDAAPRSVARRALVAAGLRRR